MNPIAVEKAAGRLGVAKNAVEDIEKCIDYEAFKGHWYIFLVATKSAYSALEQGAKTSPQSLRWFGEKNAERKSDPLLQYLFQARNDDEHGTEPVTELIPHSLQIGVNEPGFSKNILLNSTPEGLRVESGDGKPVLVRRTLPHPRLKTVRVRGVSFDPPTEHKGAKLNGDSPLAVAKLGLAHLTSLIEEAKTLS